MFLTCCPSGNLRYGKTGHTQGLLTSNNCPEYKCGLLSWYDTLSDIENDRFARPVGEAQASCLKQHGIHPCNGEADVVFMIRNDNLLALTGWLQSSQYCHCIVRKESGIVREAHFDLAC